MKAFVDPDLCIGCTQCAGICPEVFSMEGTLAVAQPGELSGELVPHRHRRGPELPRLGDHGLGIRKTP